ncbi:MAG TPA: hypothetical protein VM802_30845 [Chitinophaga sp.]|uniref:hypothetical protein n=1 Tax=Chitinophaga sp. TaxID=1869181 RepID=UPI002BF84E19|nr:hypothetical protein [Chitinophaga sp.]HVI49303.1 hypothetical protein [Chitinophaga sp.]
MKRCLCLLVLLSVIMPAAAQSNDTATMIVHTRALKKGLYKTFSEFQQNNPSEDGDIVIRERSSAAQIYLLASRNELVLRSPDGQEHKIKKYWGYCDGKNIYIKDNGLNKIQETGYYCLYELHGVQPSRAIYNQADMTVMPMSTPLHLKKVINIVTGEILELSVYNLRKYILPQDPELLKEFLNDKERHEQQEYYILRFNQRNSAIAK